MDQQQQMENSPPSTAHSQRIIVVEDMAVVAADIEYTLMGLGYEVPLVVSTGEEAMEGAAEVRPDLVLMDINLAGQIDGVEAAEWIRAHLQIPVIFLTAYSDTATLQRAKVTEPFGYIVKPINKRELQANIEIALYRSQLERALGESEARYTAVVQQSAECILLVDVDGRRLIEANPAAQRLLGYSAEEMEGLTLHDIVSEAPAEIDQQIRELLKQRRKFLGEGRYRRKDSSLIDVETNASLISYGGSEVMCVISRDITARKRAEAALQAAEEELEGQRALSMRSDRLRSLGEMAAGIAHELSQPLVGVRGLAEHLLLSLERGWELSEEKLSERLSQIIEQADRMVHIIQHVRLFAREAGKAETKPVQVNEVVQSSQEMLGAQFRAHGLELTAELGGELPLVRANPFSLEEVLLNLLSNARDAVEERLSREEDGFAPQVVARTGAGDGRVWIEVEDNGTGIPAEIIGKVFDPFFTTKDPDKGTGLGLAIARSILEEFDGELTIRSAPGQGTTVRLLLPVAEGFGEVKFSQNGDQDLTANSGVYVSSSAKIRFDSRRGQE